MGKHTKISWCDSTLGLTMGCSGCELGPGCFARQLCQRFAGKKGYPKDFSKPEFFLHRLAELRKWPDLRGTLRPAVYDGKMREIVPTKPWLNHLPRLVFLSDLGEMFDPKLPDEWLARRWQDETRQTVLEYLASLPHVFIILTKQARRMADFFQKFPCPPNLWLGVSVTDRFTRWRVDGLLKIDCRVRIISHEPATGEINYGDRLKGIAQLISGGQSGRHAAPCDLAWLRADRDQAKAAGIAFFAKQLGACAWSGAVEDGWLFTVQNRSGSDPSEWGADLQNCREVPKPESKPAAGQEKD